MTGFKVNKMIPDEGLALGPSSDSRQGQTKEKTTMKQLMKSAALLASVGVAMLSVAGCNSVGDKAEDVVLAVLKNTQAGKTDQAFLNKYCEEDTAKLFTTFGSQMTEALKGATFTVAYSFVDDDVAVVKIQQEGGKKPGASYYDAKKIDGQWKVKINKETHDDYWCISQKTINESVEAFKATFSGNVKYKERCTEVFLGQVQQMISKAPSPEALNEVVNSLKELKIKECGKPRGDSVSIELEIPMKGTHGQTYQEDMKLILKISDGHWKLSEFKK